MTTPAVDERLMYMRDRWPVAERDGVLFHAVRSRALRAGTSPAAVNGELAGGMVMSLTMRRDRGIVVAVTSTMAHGEHVRAGAAIWTRFAASLRPIA